MFTTVIRIEHPADGMGIFGWRKEGQRKQYGWGTYITPTFTYYPKEIGDMLDRHMRFPTPIGGGMIPSFDDWFCAYKSVEQIQSWIMPEEFKQLAGYGFRVYMIDVSEYIQGEYQVVYKKEHILQQKDVTSLFI